MGVRRGTTGWPAALLLVAPLTLGLGIACAARMAPALAMVQVPHRDIRVALAAERGIARITTGGEWRLTDRAGREIVRPIIRLGWGIERRGSRVRAIQADGYTSPWVDSLLVLVGDDPAAPVQVNGRSYRGSLLFEATDSATLVINVVPVEQYLRGVVPPEIGARPATDVAAVEAQAVVARSFAFERMNTNLRRRYDLTSLELDQVYGGIDAESAQGDAAISATRDLVLSYNGRAIGALYHAVCGGNTSSAGDVWKSGDVPYLQGVSDRVPGSDRAYCDLAPRFQWERSFTAAALRDAAARYLRQYVPMPTGSVGSVREVQIAAHTSLGRVAALSIVTEQGAYRLRGNDIRYVLRGLGGDLLPSTYFSLEPVVGRDGMLTQLAIRGRGNGHGVGLCQWGAIGRARAGQDVRTILRAYFPATELARGT